MRLLGAILSASTALLVVFHNYLGWMGSLVSGMGAGLALRYAGTITGNLEGFMNSITQVELCLVALERLAAYAELQSESELVQPSDDVISSDGAVVQWRPIKGEIQFTDVVMSYRADLAPVLQGISFLIPGGTSIGIVGRTGEGKSTVLQALFRMCELQSGVVSIDGMDISKLGLHTLRSSLAIIPQDPVGFTGSVRFNLDPFQDHTDDEIMAELAKVQLRAFVEAKGEGLDYQLSAGGDNLSVGQRQLLCAARAFLRGCRILVLDEATASVDFATDALIQDALKFEVTTKNLTTLTIAHRINTILSADRVLVVKGGRAAEFGQTQELANDTSSLFYTFLRPGGHSRIAGGMQKAR